MDPPSKNWQPYFLGQKKHHLDPTTTQQKQYPRKYTRACTHKHKKDKNKKKVKETKKTSI